MPNRYSGVQKLTEKMPCGHEANEDNCISFGNFRTCFTCRNVFEWIPGHWKKKTRPELRKQTVTETRPELRPELRKQTVTETSKTEDASREPEKVSIVE